LSPFRQEYEAKNITIWIHHHPASTTQVIFEKESQYTNSSTQEGASMQQRGELVQTEKIYTGPHSSSNYVTVPGKEG